MHEHDRQDILDSESESNLRKTDSCLRALHNDHRLDAPLADKGTALEPDEVSAVRSRAFREDQEWVDAAARLLVQLLARQNMVDDFLQLLFVVAAFNIDGVKHLRADSNDRHVLVPCLHDRGVGESRQKDHGVEPRDVVAQDGRGRDFWIVAVFIIWPKILAVVNVQLGLLHDGTGK